MCNLIHLAKLHPTIQWPLSINCVISTSYIAYILPLWKLRTSTWASSLPEVKKSIPSTKGRKVFVPPLLLQQNGVIMISHYYDCWVSLVKVLVTFNAPNSKAYCHKLAITSRNFIKNTEHLKSCEILVQSNPWEGENRCLHYFIERFLFNHTPHFVLNSSHRPLDSVTQSVYVFSISKASTIHK